MSKHYPHTSETQIHFISQLQNMPKIHSFHVQLHIQEQAYAELLFPDDDDELSSPGWAHFSPCTMSKLGSVLAESNLGSNMACICLHMDLPPCPCERFSTAESVWSKRYCSSICSLLLAAPCLPAWWRTRPLVTQGGLSMFNYSSTIGLKCWCRGTAQLHMPLPSPYENVGELQYHH